MCHDYRRCYVLYLDPETLLKEGAVCHVQSEDLTVKGFHYFLITREMEDNKFCLTPLFSESGSHRILVNKLAMVGAPEFTEKTFHYIYGSAPKFNQVWVASADAIAAAAAVAGDKTSPENRNSIKENYVPDIPFV